MIGFAKVEKGKTMADLIDRQAAIKELREMATALYGYDAASVISCAIYKLQNLPSAEPKSCEYWDAESNYCALNRPSAQPEWNNHTVACLLAELFDDTCACNYNGIDEWLPSKCELLDSCPNPVGVACWEQYLKHRTERGTDETN